MSLQQWRFEPGWESLERYEVPDWYLDGKFGIFIHWGAYSVPAFGNEWYPRNMYDQESPVYEHHRQMWGPQNEFGYKDFIARFKAERFNADEWAELFERSGARFVVPVAEHHDGFAMYSTSLSEWNATRVGPRRDVIGELANAVRDHGLVFGLSSHRAEHWWFFNSGIEYDSDVRDPRYASLYGPAMSKERQPDDEFLRDWLARCKELVDKYQPQLVWFDWWIEEPAFEPYLREFASYYYNRGLEWGKGVAINYKHDAFREGTAVLDIERGQLAGIRDAFWQTDTSISKNSWGYVEEQDYKSTRSIIGDLVDIVSKNGALLLNIGPRADSTIPERERDTLLEIGSWLQVNGEAIYGTRSWTCFGEGPTQIVEGSFKDTERASFTEADFRFTTKGDALYAICLGSPPGQSAIASLGLQSQLTGDIRKVTMLGHDGELDWTQDADALRITPPAELPCDHAVTYRIELIK